MKESKRKLFGTIVGIIVFILCLLSLTFAYYVWKSANTNVDVGIHDGGLKYVYKSSANIEGANLSPILDYTDSSYYTDANYGKYLIYSDYTATNTKSDTYMMYAKINIISMSDILKSTSFKWVLLEKVGDSYSKLLNSGDFSNLGVGSNTIYSDIYIEPEEIKEYRFIVYIDGNSSNSSNMQSASIKANLELCDQVVPIYPITLDNQGADSNKGGTSMIYEKYGIGTYKDSTAKNELMTTSSNGITNPTRTGYTFGGYYTASNGGGVNLIGANSYITSNFTNKYFNKASTLYAKWSINKYNLTINPNGGIYNNSTSTVNVSQDYNTMYGVLPATRTGYTFNKWNLSGSGTLMRGNASADSSYNFGDKSVKTDTDGTGYTNYTFSYTNSGSGNYYPSIRFNNYAYTSGHKYRITYMMRVRKSSGFGYAHVRHSAFHNDWGSSGWTYKNISVTDGWVEYSMERTFTGTTLTLEGNTYNIDPCVEIYFAIAPGTTGEVDMDMKNLSIYDVTANTYISNENYGGYVYRFGAGNGTLTGDWSANTYNINYTLNNGTKGTNAPSSGNYDSNVTIDNPTKTITVTGDANGTGATIGSATSKAQTFAGWTANNINTSTAKYGDSTSSITNSWSNGSNLVKSKYFKNLNPTNGSTVTLTANWTPVSFNLPTVSKTGYTCNWNTKNDGSGDSYASGGSYTPTATQGNVTLYATCSANKYTVTYDQNYYSDNLWNDSFYPSQYVSNSSYFSSVSNVEEPTARSGNAVKIVMNSGTSYGPFLGYRTKLTAGKTYTWSVYVKASSNKNLLIGDEQNGEIEVNVTTSWQRITHTFTAVDYDSYKAFVFYLKSGSWDDGDELYIHSLDIREGSQPVTSSSLSYDSKLGDSVKELTRTGYTFDGWYTDPVGGSKVDSATSVPASNTTYYAHWTANKVYLDLNLYLDGTGINSSTATSNGLSVGFRVNNVDVGYVTDYYTQNYYGVPYEIYGVKVDDTNISSYTKSGTVGSAYTAVSADFYTMNVKSNNNDYGTVSPSKYIVPSGGTYTTSGNKLTLNDSRSVLATAKNIVGYTTSFSNWSPSSGTITTTNTITANFTSNVNSYNVNYDCTTNGGSGTIASVKTNYGANVDLTKTCTPKTGYTFVGWNTTSSAVSKLDSLKMGANDVVVYAIYKKNVAATFYYYDNGIKNVSSSCDLYNNNTSCSASVPLSTFNGTTSQYGSVYVGYGGLNSIGEDNSSTVALSADATYYVAYRKAITEYSSGNSRTVYRNSFFTSNSAMNTVLSTSNTGVVNYSADSWTNNSIVWNFYGYATSVDSAVRSYSSVASAATSTAVTLSSLYLRSVAATFYYYDGSNQATASASGVQIANYTGNVVEQGSITPPSVVTASKGPNNGNYTGLSTSVNSTSITSTINTSQNKYYAVYNGTHVASFVKENDNVSSIGSSSLSCNNNSTTNGSGYSSSSCSITLPTITPASGYVASGWYNSSGTTVGNALDNLTLTSSATYTAKAKRLKAEDFSYDNTNTGVDCDDVQCMIDWFGTSDEYTISYNANGGSGTMDSQTISYNDSFSIKSNTFTKTGYAFAGWTTKSDGSDDGYGWTGKSGTWTYTNGKNGISGNKLVLYARWTISSYKVSYTLNGGVLGSSAPTSTNYDSVITIDNPTKTVTVTGNVNGTGATIGSAVSKAQTFAGWTASNLNTSTAKYGSSSTSVTTSWSSGSTKVTNKYFKNLSSTNGATVTLTANWTPVSFNLPTVSKTGYNCNWNTSSDGSGASYASGASYTPTATQGDVTLYAQCRDLGYTVTYDYKTNGGTSATKTTAEVETGSAIDLTPTATKSNWTFVGWNTDKSATSALTSLTMESSDVTLYAIYKKDVTATFYYYGSSSSWWGSSSGSIKNTSASCTMYNTATSCNVTVPLSTFNSTTSQYGASYVGYGALNTIGTSTSSSLSLSDSATYYAAYSKSITEYVGGSSRTIYRNAFFTSTSAMSTVLSTSSMGTTNLTTSSYTANSTTYSWNGYATSSSSSSSTYSSVSAAATSTTTTLYTLYTRSVTATFYYYGSSSSWWGTGSQQSTTASGNQIANYKGDGVGEGSITVPSAVTSSTGPGSRAYAGVSTSTSSSTTTSTVNTSQTKYYAVYSSSLTATFTKENTNVSSIGSSSLSCNSTAVTNGTTYSSSNCSVTLPTITPASGYKTLGWYNSSGTLVGQPGASITLTASATYTAKVESSGVSSSSVALGSYISMTPTKSSYTTDTSKTGYSSTQTINPQELKLWRVISKNSDGTVDMISEYVSTTSISFQGKSGFVNYIGYLNLLASQYENSTYTKSSRHFGYSSQTQYITDTSKFANSAPWSCSTSADCSTIESQGGGDLLYQNDYNLVKNVLGTLVAKEVGSTSSSSSGSYYLISSRYYYYNSSSYFNWQLRYLNSSGTLKNSKVYDCSGTGGLIISDYVNGDLRPILTLKSGLKYSGSGTEDDPYKLSTS